MNRVSYFTDIFNIVKLKHRLGTYYSTHIPMLYRNQTLTEANSVAEGGRLGGKANVELCCTFPIAKDFHFMNRDTLTTHQNRKKLQIEQNVHKVRSIYSVQLVSNQH